MITTVFLSCINKETILSPLYRKLYFFPWWYLLNIFHKMSSSTDWPQSVKVPKKLEIGKQLMWSFTTNEKKKKWFLDFINQMSLGDTVNHTVMTLNGDRWQVHLPWWAFHNIIVESPCCIPEANTILYVNYTSIKIIIHSWRKLQMILKLSIMQHKRMKTNITNVQP